MKTWLQRWKAFLIVVFDPWVLVFIAAGLGLGAVLVEQTDPKVVVTLTLVISVVSGVLGGLITTRFTALTEQKVLAARGKAAVRSLHLLLRNISALHGRTHQHLDRVDVEDPEEAPDGEVVATYLEEVMSHCRVLEEEALSSIENWTDIVPEADVKTQIGLITELRNEADQKAQELTELHGQLEEAQDESAEEQKRLQKLVAAKENELRKAQAQLAGHKYHFVLTGERLQLDPRIGVSPDSAGYATLGQRVTLSPTVVAQQPLVVQPDEDDDSKE